MIVEGKHIYIHGEKEVLSPLVIIHTFQGDESDVYTALKGITDKNVCLAVISDINWNEEMSPWECPAFNKNDSPFTGGADNYLEKLVQKIVPAIKNELEYEPEEIIIAGYSLAGLFAIYSLYKTDIFSAAVSASGSMWYPRFKEFAETHDLLKKPDKVYFSLGDKEAKTRNAILSTVEENTSQIYERYNSLGIDTVFEMNPGNHFKDADIRLAKGIAWVVK